MNDTSRLHPCGPLTLTLLAAALACGGDETPTEVVAAPRPVRSAIALPASGTVETAIAGVTQASTESKLSFRVGGSIEELPVKVGSSVRRGDLIARLDPADLEIAAEQAQASLAQVEALLRQARADFERVRGLYENNNASKSDLDAARAAAESAEAQVGAARKAVEQAQRQRDYATLRAPSPGSIVSVDAEINETVGAGQTVVLLASGSRPEVILAVSEVNIPLIEVGDTVSVVVEAVGLERLRGTVTEVGVALSPGSATYPAVVRLDDAPAAVRSGMAAEVFLDLDNPEQGVVVPRVAVGADTEGNFVFVVEGAADSATVSRRAVTVGGPSPTEITITAGLDVGERVVTAGVRRLTDGMKVRMMSGDES